MSDEKLKRYFFPIAPYISFLFPFSPKKDLRQLIKMSEIKDKINLENKR